MIVSLWVCITRHTQTLKTTSLYLCNISYKEWRFDFLPADNCPRFLKSDSVMCLARHAQSTQNKKFVISPQYLQASIKTYYKLIIWFWWQCSTISKISEICGKVAMSWQYLKKEVRDKAEFLHVDKHQSGLQVDFNSLGSKVSYKVILWLLMSMIKHFQSTQSKKLANLCNISKKLVMKFIFCMQINIPWR